MAVGFKNYTCETSSTWFWPLQPITCPSGRFLILLVLLMLLHYGLYLSSTWITRMIS